MGWSVLIHSNLELPKVMQAATIHKTTGSHRSTSPLHSTLRWIHFSAQDLWWRFPSLPHRRVPAVSAREEAQAHTETRAKADWDEQVAQWRQMTTVKPQAQPRGILSAQLDLVGMKLPSVSGKLLMFLNKTQDKYPLPGKPNQTGPLVSRVLGEGGVWDHCPLLPSSSL